MISSAGSGGMDIGDSVREAPGTAPFSRGNSGGMNKNADLIRRSAFFIIHCHLYCSISRGERI